MPNAWITYHSLLLFRGQEAVAMVAGRRRAAAVVGALEGRQSQLGRARNRLQGVRKGCTILHEGIHRW